MKSKTVKCSSGKVQLLKATYKRITLRLVTSLNKYSDSWDFLSPDRARTLAKALWKMADEIEAAK